MEEKYKGIIEKIEKLTVMELSELIKEMEQKFGVSAAVPLSGTPASDEAAASPKEKTAYSLELKNAGGAKVQVIKTVKELLGLGLKEAKDIVDAAPKIIKENISKADAEEMKKKLEEAGAAVEIK